MGLNELKKMREELERQEGKTHGGARSRAPKQQLLDASDLQEKMPDKRVRWIQVGNADKAAVRLAEGYEVIPESEGGRRVGGLATASIPREVYEEKVADVRRKNAERLKAHKSEVQQAVMGVVKELRDRHGIQIDERRLFVDE